nr:hypothetical protein [Amycolatopsis sp. CA-230715]
MSPARWAIRPASIAPISRGATSLPSGDPSATVTICSNACQVVASTGIR